MFLLIILLIGGILYCLVHSNKEGFGKLMPTIQNGVPINVPALCTERKKTHCETTDGCVWKNDKCTFKRGWTTGSIGTQPMYVIRECRKRTKENCAYTDGCVFDITCKIKDNYKEVNNIDGEIVHVPAKCSDRTIDECGSGENCIWLQGKCIRRDSNQKHMKLHNSIKNCNLTHNKVGFGSNMFSCSNKPVPLAPSKLKTGIKEQPASQQKLIPTMEQTKTCIYSPAECNKKYIKKKTYVAPPPPPVQKPERKKRPTLELPPFFRQKGKLSIPMPKYSNFPSNIEKINLGVTSTYPFKPSIKEMSLGMNLNNDLQIIN